MFSSYSAHQRWQSGKLAVLLYQSRVVPRALPLLSLIGAPLLAVGTIGTLLNLWGGVSSVSALLALPVAIFEFSLGVYLIVKGFKPSSITPGNASSTGR